MNPFKLSFQLAAALLFVLGVSTGCETTGGGNTRVNSYTYYGSGYNDPYYYGHNNYNGDVIVTPPPPGKPPGQGLHPSQPIARPPQVSRPMPSIPSAPRPAMRR